VKALCSVILIFVSLGVGGCRGVSREPASARAEPAGRGPLELLRWQQDAWNRGDIDAFMDGYLESDDITFSGSSGTKRGWTTIKERFKRRYPDRAAMGRTDFSDLELIELGPDAALVTGKWRVTRDEDPIGGVFSVVLRRYADGWRVIHDHTSVVPDEE